MALILDTSRPLRSVSERQRLVEAIRDAPAHEQETDAIEWKGTVDLAEKKWQAEIARQVIGFANRHPGRAAMTFGGCAYLVLGVSPGSVVGITPVDAAKLDDTVCVYAGKDGPQWSPDYVQVDGQPVLVITVEPPQWGHPMFALRKTFETYEDGDVFTRRNGKTQKANHQEIRMLSDRAAAQGDRLGIDLEWFEAPSEAAALDVSEEAVDAWIEQERATLLAASGVRRRLREGTVGAATFEDRVRRERPEHEKKVEAYLTKVRPYVRDIWRSQVQKAELGQMDLAIVNLTEHNFAAVKVVMEFQGDVWSAFSRFDIDTSGFPERPRSWASREKEFAPAQASSSSIWDSLRAARVMSPTVDPSKYLDPLKSAGSSTNSGSTTLTFSSVDVRPAYRHHIGPAYLMASAEYAGEEIEGTWYATSTSASGIARGVFTVRVASEPLVWSRATRG
jgi:hypothetical protein